MFKQKLFLIVVLLSFLSGCAATKKQNEENETKVKTAKINAQLGIAYLEQKNIQRAKTKLLRAINQAPEIPETWYSMAYFYEATGDKLEARKHYLKALALAPKRGDVQNNYGTFLCRSGEYKASIQHFLLAVQDKSYLDPADAYENAGMCAMKLPNNEQAASYFQQAIAEDSARPVSLIKLAEISYKKGDYSDSQERLNQFLTISPPNPGSERLSKLLLIKMRPELTQPVKLLNSSVSAELAEKSKHNDNHITLKKKNMAQAKRIEKPTKPKKVAAKVSKKSKAKQVASITKKSAIKTQVSKHTIAGKKSKHKTIAKTRSKKSLNIASKKGSKASKAGNKNVSPSFADADKKPILSPVKPLETKKFHQVQPLLAENKTIQTDVHLV